MWPHTSDVLSFPFNFMTIYTQSIQTMNEHMKYVTKKCEITQASFRHIHISTCLGNKSDVFSEENNQGKEETGVSKLSTASVNSKQDKSNKYKSNCSIFFQ